MHLVITTYNRPNLLRLCLESLKQCDFDNVIFVDDCSKDPDVLPIIRDYSEGVINARIIKKTKRAGIKHSLKIGIEAAFKDNAELVMNLDPDAIVSPKFLTKMLELRSAFPDRIISGFNTDNKANPVLSKGRGFVTKKHCNGINMLFDKSQYLKHIAPALQKNAGNWDYDTTHGRPFVIACPSLIEHVGWDSSTMGHILGDRSIDFKKIKH